MHSMNNSTNNVNESDEDKPEINRDDRTSVSGSTTARNRNSFDGGGIDETELAIEEDVPDARASQKQSNTYAAKKTVAQGMMDIALITANANQLRYIIEFNRHSSTFYLNVSLIVISLILQVGVGVSLIFKGRLDMKGQSKHRNAKRINNYVVVGVFLITIINVFIASFTITGNNMTVVSASNNVPSLPA